MSRVVANFSYIFTFIKIKIFFYNWKKEPLKLNLEYDFVKMFSLLLKICESLY